MGHLASLRYAYRGLLRTPVPGEASGEECFGTLSEPCPARYIALAWRHLNDRAGVLSVARAGTNKVGVSLRIE